jgi:hypothetical protein
MTNEVKVPKRLIGTAVLAVIALIVAVSIGGNAFEDVPAGKYQVRQQWVTGNMDAKMTPGMWKQFGTIMEFPLARTFYGTADNDGAGDSEDDKSVTVRYADGSEASISFTARAEMPKTTAEAIALVKIHSFRSYEEVENKLLLPVFRRALRSTATLMTARESYSEKRNDFLVWTWDQVQNGPYITKATERTVIDPLSGEEVTRTFQEIVLDEHGNKTHAQNPLKGKGIYLDNFEIKDFNYLGKVNEQIVTQQEAMMNIATAKAKSQEAEQEAIRLASVGKAAVVKAKYEKEVQKVMAVTEALKNKEVAELKAEQEYQVAILAKKSAAETKAKDILLGQGEAERKRLVMAADGALKQKLDAYVTVQKNWATAIQNYSGNWVPTTVLGGSGAGESGNGAQTMIDLLTVKTAKDLQLDTDVRTTKK